MSGEMLEFKYEPRRDIHRRGAFQPQFYKFFGWYYLGKRGEKSVRNCDKKIFEFFCTEEAQDFKATTYGDFGRCGVCGAVFALGEIWQHTETMDLVHIGCDCTAKYRMVSGTDWKAYEDERRRRLKAEKTREKNDKARAELNALYPGLSNVLEINHYINRNMKHRFERDGLLTVSQVELAYKIAREEFERAIKAMKIEEERRAEKHVEAPTGRVTFRGRVVSKKVHENDFGSTWKMTVKVEKENGSWLGWGTIPDALLGAPDVEVKVGDVVELTGTLQAGNEKHFAFFKRPTKASIVERKVVA